MNPGDTSARLDYDSLDKKETLKKELEARKVLTYFKQNGLEVSSYEPCKKPKRESGVPTKEIKLEFLDGQTVSFKVKGSGIIYQVKVNRDIVPVHKNENMKDFITQISRHVSIKADLLQKAQERSLNKMAKQVSKDTATNVWNGEENGAAQSETQAETQAATEKPAQPAKPKPQSTKAKLEAGKAATVAKQQEMQEIQQKTASVKQEIASMDTEIESVKNKISQAQNRRKQLESEYLSLGGNKGLLDTL